MDSAMQAELRQARQRFVTGFDRRCEELAQLGHAASTPEGREEFARAVHRMVGAAGLVSCLQLSKEASALEQYARTDEATAEQLVERLDGLRDAYAKDEASPPDWSVGDDDERPAPLTLVLAEDDDHQRQTLARLLEAAGHTVTSVSRGDQVLAAVRQQMPSVLLLDVQLPGLDGHAVCRQVKSDPALSGVAVVFVTAAISADDRLAGLLLGADDYVEKPVDLADLNMRLSMVAERRARGESQPQRLAPGELAYPDFVTRASDQLQHGSGALVLLRMPAQMGLPVATWLAGELRRDDMLGRYRDDLRLLFLPGLLARTAVRHVDDIVTRLAGAGLSVSAGVAVTERPGERSFGALLHEADGHLAAATAGAPSPAPVATHGPAGGGVAAVQHRSVLIADDDEMTRRLVERPLARAGFRCRAVSDGQHTLDELEAEMAEVLIMDLDMPRVSGLQVLEALQGRPGPRPAIIVISASREEEKVRKALALGADDYVVKPFNPLVLLTRVRRLMP